jgi:hypothetical protein
MYARSLNLATLIALVLFLAIPFSQVHASTLPAIISVDPPTNLKYFAAWPALSANGRYVAYYSGRLFLDDSSQQIQDNEFFLHDLDTGSTTRVDVASDGTQTIYAQNSQPKFMGGISGDGRYIVFKSISPNLVPNDTIQTLEIYVHDMMTGSTTRVSVASDGAEANSTSNDPTISEDGRYVAFDSLASNLVPNDTNGVRDAFVHDMLTGSTTRVSVASDGTEGNSDTQTSSHSALSGDGRYVVFNSQATNLDPNGQKGVFVHDMLTGSTTHVGGGGFQPAISGDGRYVVSDGVLSDLETGSTTVLGVGFTQNSISRDGRYVTGNGVVYDTVSGLSIGDGATSISPDGTHIAVGGLGNHASLIEDLNPFIPTNQAPVLAPIGNQAVNEGQNLSFTLSATDPDSGDTLTYSATNTPPGAVFDPATRVFSWTPDYTQAGNYPDVEFVVSDNGSPMMLDFEDITITVGNVNRAPIFAAVGPQQILEHATTTFTVSATDPDGNSVTLSASGMPSGATFNTSTGVFSWTPGYPTAGVYTPTFTATDNGSPVATSSIDVVITVGSNPTPTEENQTLTNTVVALNLPGNIENQYLQNLNKVGPYIDQGRTDKAISELNKFINKVNNDYAHGNITLTVKNELVTMAQNLINALSS